MLSDLLRPFQPKCGDVPLGFYLDSSMVCNRLTAQRVSAASLCLSRFLPLLSLIYIHCVCATVCVCVQLCFRCVSLTITKMSGDEREMRRQRNRKYIVPFLTSCKLAALCHCKDFSRSLFKSSIILPVFQPQETSFSFHSWADKSLCSKVLYTNYPGSDWLKTSFMTATTFVMCLLRLCESTGHC